MKKFLALLLALTMVLSLGTVAFAAKAAPTTEHQYKAYQIFSGTQGEGSELGNVVWGGNIEANANDFLAALKADATIGSKLADCDSAAAVANVMKDWADNSAEAKAFAKVADKFVTGEGFDLGDTLPAGYYLVVDETETVGADDAYNLSLLQLTKKGAFEVKQKSEVPEVEKTVSDASQLKCEENHTHTKDCYNWTESNTVALGDTVNFKVESAVPAAAADYDYYYFIINDTLSDGLTLDPASIVVYINGVAAADYTVKVNGQNIQIALTDAKAHANQSVVVYYDATLNNGAIIGVEGNPNEVDVKYSNNPNEKYDGTQNDDGFPKDENYNPGGVTPKDYTLTYTTELKVYKVDENNKPLNGAQFTLTGDTLNAVLVYKEVFTAAEDGTYYLLKNGTYTKEAPKADSYREATAADGRNGGYVKDGDNYVEATADDLAGDVQLYILVKGDADKYANDGKMYKMEQVFERQAADTEKHSVVAYVDANGEVIFTGLDEGSYTLSETVVPNGYNPIDAIEFEIEWVAPADADVEDGVANCSWNVVKGDVTYNNGAFEITVENQKGGTLPETGGIGTTIFYVVGAVLVLAAGILLITKKRMGAEG